MQGKRVGEEGEKRKTSSTREEKSNEANAATVVLFKGKMQQMERGKETHKRRGQN